MKEKGTRLRKVSVSRIETALRETRGLVATAARRIGCCTDTIYRAIQRHPHLRELIEHERALFVDECELGLAGRVAKGDTIAMIFALKTLGRGRGYQEHQQHEHGGAGEFPGPEPVVPREQLLTRLRNVLEHRAGTIVVESPVQTDSPEKSNGRAKSNGHTTVVSDNGI